LHAQIQGEGRRYPDRRAAATPSSQGSTSPGTSLKIHMRECIVAFPAVKTSKRSPVIWSLKKKEAL